MTASRLTLLFFVALMCMECFYTASLSRGFDPRLSDEMVAQKRGPFCNNFSGCLSSKRSQPTPGMPLLELRERQYVNDETLGSILDSENAIEDFSRQILSEAKLWEAIQEASAEIARRKQKESFN